MEEKGRKSNNHPQTKKNPYIMTIGFDRTDPRHVEVADFLNSLPRKKAQYIVESVKHYQSQNKEIFSRSIEEKNVDRETVRQIVMQILEEGIRDTNQYGTSNFVNEDTKVLKKFNEDSDAVNIPQFDGDLLNEVRDSLAAFRI